MKSNLVLLCDPGWPRTHVVAQADPQLWVFLTLYDAHSLSISSYVLGHEDENAFKHVLSTLRGDKGTWEGIRNSGYPETRRQVLSMHQVGACGPSH